MTVRRLWIDALEPPQTALIPSLFSILHFLTGSL
jgi:hypothetical protein